MNRQPRILVVDDDEQVRNVLQTQLQSPGWEVVTVADGQQALDALEERVFDVMILDQAMPGLSGIDVLERAVPRFSHIDIVMLTGMGNEKIAAESIKKGAKDYLIKPIDLHQIVQLVRVWLEAKKLPNSVWAQQMDAFLEANLANPNFEMAHVQEKFGLSEGYVCKLFRQELDMTFRQRRAFHRIEKAKRLLVSSNMSVMAVGEACGFRSQKQFRDVFYRREGKSPSQYRKISTSKQENDK